MCSQIRPIRVFYVRLKTLWILAYPQNALRIHVPVVITISSQAKGYIYKIKFLLTNVTQNNSSPHIWTESFEPWACWNRICPAFANSVDPDQLVSSKANWSGSALFASKYVNLYQQFGSCNLIGWKLEWMWRLNLFSRTRVNTCRSWSNTACWAEYLVKLVHIN